jgi:hypothetical protein
MTGRALPNVAGDLTVEPVSRYTCLALELLSSAFAAGTPAHAQVPPSAINDKKAQSTLSLLPIAADSVKSNRSAPTRPAQAGSG